MLVARAQSLLRISNDCLLVAGASAANIPDATGLLCLLEVNILSFHGCVVLYDLGSVL